MGEQFILRIQRIRRRGSLLVSGAEQHQPVQMFDAPARADEFRSQPIEQSRVARRITARAEISRGPHQGLTEMLHPDAIDKNARGERIGAGSNRLSKLEPPAALREWARLATAEQAHEGAWNRVAQARGIAAFENVRLV